ncbi:MAG: hypothetical protein BJ554DRAFT_1160, partial [Olpidium bornovanus]
PPARPLSFANKHRPPGLTSTAEDADAGLVQRLPGALAMRARERWPQCAPPCGAAAYRRSPFAELGGRAKPTDVAKREPPENPVVSKKTGNVYEKRVITKYISENAKEPGTNEELSVDDLLEVNVGEAPVSPEVRP